MTTPIRLIAALAVCFVFAYTAQAVSVDLSTAANAANWKITGAGGTAASAFQVTANGPGEISLTSNGLSNGTFVSGATLAAFNGFWYADESFTLPANAIGVSLAFSNLFGNDRTVLELNGVILGNVDHLGNTGPAVFSFPPGPPDVPYTITGTTSGTITTGFLLGQTNTLRLITNNTGTTSINSPTATFQTAGDATDAGVTATLTYNVPEPATLTLLLIPAALTLRRQRRL